MPPNSITNSLTESMTKLGVYRYTKFMINMAIDT
jgi:hypothetical protein